MSRSGENKSIKREMMLNQIAHIVIIKYTLRVKHEINVTNQLHRDDVHWSCTTERAFQQTARE